MTYTIAPGDTLANIAAQTQTTVDAIMVANEDLIQDPNYIQAGWTIQLPSEATIPEGASMAPGTDTVDLSTQIGPQLPPGGLPVTKPSTIVLLGLAAAVVAIVYVMSQGPEGKHA